MHPKEQINVIIGRIYRSGMTTTSGGNISIKDGNGDIWITPSAVDKGSLTVKDIVCGKWLDAEFHIWYAYYLIFPEKFCP